MSGKLTHIVSIGLLMIFLWPSVIKLEHHHEHHCAHSESGVNLHTVLEKCTICNFEFSVFSETFFSLDLADVKPSDSYTVAATSPKFPNQSQFSFLLRGPPCV